MQINGKGCNSLIHSKGFDIGRGEKSCCGSMWELVLESKRGGDGHRTEEEPES
jgi:hypothetical protein